MENINLSDLITDKEAQEEKLKKDRKDFDEFVRRGDAALNGFLLKESLENYNSAKNIFKDDAIVNFKIGDVHQLCEYNTCNSCLENYIIAKKNALDKHPHYKLSEALFLVNGYTDEVKEHLIDSNSRYTKELSEDPQNYSVNLYLGITYLYMSKFVLASKYIDYALELFPTNKLNTDYDCYFYKGEIELKKKNYNDAIKFFTKHCENNESSIFSLYKLGYLYCLVGNEKQALNCLNKAIEIDKNFIDAHYLKDQILLLKPELNNNIKHQYLANVEQLALIKSEREKIIEGRENRVKAKQLCEEESFDLALEYVNKSLEKDQKNFESNYLKTLILMNLFKYDEAKTYCQSVKKKYYR